MKLLPVGFFVLIIAMSWNNFSFASSEGKGTTKSPTVTGLGKEGREAFLRGIKHYKGKSYAQAEQALSLAIAQGYRTNKVFLLRSLTYFALKKKKAAMADVIEAIRLNPKDPECYWIRAGFFKLQGAKHKAIEDFTRGLKSKPKTELAKMIYADRGSTYLELEELELARHDLTMAIKMGDSSVSTLSNRGRTYMMLGKYENAIEDFSAALMRDSHHYESRVNRAWVYGCLERFDKSLQDFNHILRNDPADVWVRNYRGWVYASLDKVEEALIDLTYGADKGVKDPWLYLDLANIYYKLEQFDKALQANTKAVEYQDAISSAAVQLQRGLLLLVSGHAEDAMQTYKKGMHAAENISDYSGLQEDIVSLKVAIERYPIIKTVGTKILENLEESLVKIPADTQNHRGCVKRDHPEKLTGSKKEKGAMLLFD